MMEHIIATTLSSDAEVGHNCRAGVRPMFFLMVINVKPIKDPVK